MPAQAPPSSSHLSVPTFFPAPPAVPHLSPSRPTVMLRAARCQQPSLTLLRIPQHAPCSRFLRRGYASAAAAADPSSHPRVGEQLHGFTFKRIKHVPELELTAFELQHDRTGAQYLHIARDDANNVFSIGFKTNPPDDTGVPHILEHTTLCGSKQYARTTVPKLAPLTDNSDTRYATPSSRCSRDRSPTS